MTKKISLALVAALVLSVGAAGCKKKKKEAPKDPTTSASPEAKGGAGASPAAVPAGGAGSTTPVAGASGIGADALASLPQNIKAAVGINMAGVKKSSFFDMLKNKMMSEDKNGEFLKFVQDCKFDPFTQIDWMVVGMEQVGKGGDFAAVVARGKFDEATLMPCVMQKQTEKADGDKFTVEDYKGKKLYISSKTPEKVMAFTSANTLVVGPKAWLTSLTDGGAKTAKDGAIAAMIGKVDTSQALWLALTELPAGGMGGPMPIPGGAPKAMWGSVDFANGIAAKLSLQLASPDAAKGMADMANAQAGMAKQFFDKMLVTASGDTVSIDIGMTEQQIKMLVGMIGMGMKRGGMGMGPGGP